MDITVKIEGLEPLAAAIMELARASLENKKISADPVPAAEPVAEQRQPEPAPAEQQAEPVAETAQPDPVEEPPKAESSPVAEQGAPEPQPAATPPEAPEPTDAARQELHNLIVRWMSADAPARVPLVKGLFLGSYGVKRVSDIPVERWPAFWRDVNEMIGGE